jgi:hypothetical protein
MKDHKDRFQTGVVPSNRWLFKTVIMSSNIEMNPIKFTELINTFK